MRTFLTCLACLFLATGPHATVAERTYSEADDGVKQTEKIRILREEYQASGNTAALRKLNNAVQTFISSKITYYNSASKRVNYLESVLNNAPEPPEEELFDYCPVMLDDDKRDVAIEKRWLSEVTTTGCQASTSLK